MLKQQERPITREPPGRTPDAAPQLPELPGEVVVPDDLRDLHVPTAPRRRASTAVRWLRWVSLLAVVAIGLVIAFVATRDGSTEVRETTPVPSGSPFDAPMLRVTEQVPSGSPFDAPMQPATEQVPFESPFAVSMSPATEQVPSGSPFDAPTTPATERVPSGSPFDAPITER